MDINLIGSISSVIGLGTSILQWLSSNRSEAKKAVIDDYLEWLRRQNHQELLDRLSDSDDLLRDVRVFIDQVQLQTVEELQKLELQIARAETQILADLANHDQVVRSQLGEMGRMIKDIEQRLAATASVEPKQQRPETFEARLDKDVFRSIEVRTEPREVQFAVQFALVNNRPSSVTVARGTAILDWNGSRLEAPIKLVGHLTIPRRGGAVVVRAETANNLRDTGMEPTLVSLVLQTLQDDKPLEFSFPSGQDR